jgi:hypothetical protein
MFIRNNIYDKVKSSVKSAGKDFQSELHDLYVSPVLARALLEADPAFAPGTGTPVVGGLSTAQALPILHSLGDLNLIGMDIVEVAPAYDHAEITALAAAAIGHDYLCLLAQKNGAQARSIGTKLDEKQSGNAKT